MADVTKSHAVFLGFCNEALDRLRDEHSYEAATLRAKLEALVKELESWTITPPSNKEATIASVLEVYRQALDFESTAIRRAR